MGKWHPVKISNHRNAGVVGAFAGCQNVQFKDLGKFFVEECLGVCPTHRGCKDMRHLLNVAMVHRKNLSPKEQLQKLLEDLPQGKAEEVSKLVSISVEEEIRRRLEATRDDTIGTPAPAVTPQVSERQQLALQKKQQQTDDSSERANLSKLKTTKERAKKT